MRKAGPLLCGEQLSKARRDGKAHAQKATRENNTLTVLNFLEVCALYPNIRADNKMLVYLIDKVSKNSAVVNYE